MPWYLHLALRQLFPTGRRFPFFTLISTLGVALGVTLLIIVMGVMGGLAFEIRHMIVDTEGEVQVKARGWISDYADVVRRVESVPGVAAATPYATDAVMIKFGSKSAFPMLRGLDLDSVGRVTRLGRYVVIGSLDDLDDDSIILSEQLAASVGASVGDTIEVYSPLIIEKLARTRCSCRGRSAWSESSRSGTSSSTAARSTGPCGSPRTSTGSGRPCTASTSA